jgi:ubiquinone/menaquinone biosynthesis C-methylase UbiE
LGERGLSWSTDARLNHADLVALLRDGVDDTGGHWADLGSGEGAFTLALAEILGPAAHITAVDRDASSLRRLEAVAEKRPGSAVIEVVVGDFTRSLRLADLDGVVMANSLHFVRDKRQVLESVRQMLQPGGRLVIVEYGADRGNPWVPHPFSFPTWEKLAAEAGFERTRLLKTIPSRFLGTLYSAVSTKPLASRSVTS